MITLRRAEERGHFDHGWRDGAAVSDETSLRRAAVDSGEVILFDLP